MARARNCTVVGAAERMARRLGDEVDGIRDGLDPRVLAYWYSVVVRDAREAAPPWLHDRISVRQDPVLPMRFGLDVSRRAVTHFMEAVERNLGLMPYSTRLYFLKVQEAVDGEVDRGLV